MMSITEFITKAPKAELHLHIEGTLEPELMFRIADTNKIQLPYASVEALRAAYQFSDLQSFLNIYYAGMQVLQQEQDFYDLTWAYLQRAAEDNIRHTEIFFDPQAHTQRGVPFEVVIHGITRALTEGFQKLGISNKLILCFLRDLTAEDAMNTLELALAHADQITAVGLDSCEIGHPPKKFQDVFDRARSEGLLTVAHAGEEGPADFIWQAINLLNVQRIDHGVRCTQDPSLIEHLKQLQIPLTVCPLSNIKLRVYSEMAVHPLREMLQAGLCATVNSDDPAYFGGYVNDNFFAAQSALGLTQKEIYQLCKNSFNASFLSKREKQRHIDELDKLHQT